MSVKASICLNCECGSTLTITKHIISDEIKLSQIYEKSQSGQNTDVVLKLFNNESIKYKLACSRCFYPIPSKAAQLLIDRLKSSGFDIVEEV